MVDSITDSMDIGLSKLWEMVKDKGSLVCCSPLGSKESDTTEHLSSKNFACKLNKQGDNIQP